MRRGFGADERGNMLVVAGVFLVLGTLVLGSAFSFMGAQEEATQRVQREGVLLDVEDLLDALYGTIRESHVKGQTNLTDYALVMRTVEDILIREAGRAGLYVALAPATHEPDLWRRADRCLGWDRTMTDHGAVVGWAADDLARTVAGVAYLVHATDGRETIRFHHYGKLEDCIATGVSFHPKVYQLEKGSLAMSGDTFVLTEELDWDDLVVVQVHPTIRDPVQTRHWNQPWEIMVKDNRDAKLVSSTPNIPGNHITFYLDAPANMPDGGLIDDIQIDVTAHLRQPSAWRLRLSAFYPDDATTAVYSEIIPVTTTRTTYTLSFPGLRGDGWLKEDIENTRWEFRMVGEHEPNQELYIDHFGMRGDTEVPRGYRLDATVEWDPIHEAFTPDRLHLEYWVPPDGTVGEVFHLQVRDAAGTLDWETIEDLAAAGSATTIDTLLADYVDVPAWVWREPVFRIVDSIWTDNAVGDDQDAVHILLLALYAELDVD